jgi:D-arginine dehydrogenase
VSRKVDIAIVGAGMAGASLAAEIGSRASVLLLEREDQPGYHSTGRSAAFWSESYGGPAVQPLTTASGPILRDGGFLSPRGGLHIAGEEGQGALDALAQELGGQVELRPVAGKALEELVPGLRPHFERALFEPSCADIDVAALHAHYLKQARRTGAELLTRAELLSAKREGGRWQLETAAGAVQAEVLVNAAGAWADPVARLAGVRPLGIRAFRRTMVQVRTEPLVPADLPLVIDALGRFYFKPEAGGRLWLSPHDETACDPCDCAPEELDLALAIDRLEKAVTWKVERVERSWAGLRSFAPDRVPVYGFASGRRDFFWFAGQGGFGIQTAPAAARMGAALLMGAEPEIDAAPYRAGRF